MLFLKPLIKTILVSCILFFALVYLGMKYHWVGFNQNDKSTELKIPKRSSTLDSENIDKISQFNNIVTDNEEDFHPQIIQTVSSNSLVYHMTKMQVAKSCTQLLSNKVKDVGLLELAIGDCVISNYRDSIIETQVEEGEIRSTKSRQAQLRRNNVLKTCQQSLSFESYSNEIEKQLLLGICISGKFK